MTEKKAPTFESRFRGHMASNARVEENMKVLVELDLKLCALMGSRDQAGLSELARIADGRGQTGLAKKAALAAEELGRCTIHG